jgi:hypothetical protein
MASRRFSFADRARAKAASRAEDERALACGEKSVADLRRENELFVFPRVEIGLPLEER